MHEEDHFRKRSWRAGPLTLTAPDPESIDSVLRWRNDPAVTEWLIQTIVDPAALKREWLDSLDNPLHHVLIARHSEDVVATGTLWIYDGQGQIHGDRNAYRNCEAGIDYLVDPRHQSRGFGGQVARVMLQLAFDELGLRRVSAGCFADNRASRRILEKLGMRLEEYSIQASWHADRGWLDGCSYAILAEEWSSHRSD